MARWMLRRVINDATLQGYPELVVHVAHEAAAALNLFVQHGASRNSTTAAIL